jgi:hypothetical protein
MRLVIDLQACQNGAARNPDAIVALVQALVCSAATRPQAHTVILALDERQQDSIDALRYAFDGLPAQLRSYRTPAGNGWMQQAAPLVRDGFLASLDPDVVFAPGLFDLALNDTLYGTGPQQALMVYTLAAGTQESSLPARQQQCLRDAALVLRDSVYDNPGQAASNLWVTLETTLDSAQARHAATGSSGSISVSNVKMVVGFSLPRNKRSPSGRKRWRRARSTVPAPIMTS